MGKNELKEVIELSPSPEKEGGVIYLNSPPPPETPPRPIFCLKKNVNMREIEEREDCFILDFDPYDSLDLSKLSMSKDLDYPDTPGLSIVAEKGQVACRDYPHSRHLCVNNPFEKTPHESYCELCYCFVCDMAAPCKNWCGVTGHCHAIDNETWKFQRTSMRKLNQ